MEKGLLEDQADDFLYWKYLGVDGLIKTIEGMTIRCNNANNLNDLFDCAPPFGFSNIEKDEYSNDYDNTFKQKVIETLRDNYVTSFTLSSWNNILMWGHYAKYEGGVIEFKNTNDLLKMGMRKVNYQDEAINVSEDFCLFFDDKRKKSPNIFNNNDFISDLERMYTTKFKAWKYEEEIRYWSGIPYENQDYVTLTSGKRLKIIKDKNRKKYIHIDIFSDDINAIYIGMKMLAIDKLKLYSAMKKQGIDVPVYSVNRNLTTDKLDRIESDFSLQKIVSECLSDIETKGNVYREDFKKIIMNMDLSELPNEILKELDLYKN